jgi:methyl halide transferase
LIEHVFNKEYWDARYQDHHIGWDLGEVSPPLKAYFDTLKDTSLAILIPGCGNSYEADYLLKQGFKNITLIDISPTLVNQLQEKHKGNSSIKIIEGDFFEHNGQYDLIIEQTFYCALHPSLRVKYVHQMNDLLKPDGLLVGLLFATHFQTPGPPFGGTTEEYKSCFNKLFEMLTIEPCYNSFQKRKGNELFVKFKKKDVMEKKGGYSKT